MIKVGEIYKYTNPDISELKIRILSIETYDIKVEVLDTYWWNYNLSVIRNAGSTFWLDKAQITKEYILVRPLKNTKPDWL